MRMLAVLFALMNAYVADNYTISGTVVDHLTNRPLNHVLVEITQVGKEGGEASVVTEADGRFVFLHVPLGKYNLQAQKRGQFPQGFRDGGDGFSTAVVVDGRLKTDDIVFPLRSDSIISGTVLGDDGEPLRHAQVHLFHETISNGEAQTIQLNSTNTNSEGQFRFGHLGAGKYYIAASGRRWYDQPGAETIYPVTFYGDTTDANSARTLALTEGAGANVQIEFHAVPAIHVKVPGGRPGFQLAVPGPGGTQIPVATSMMNVTNAGRSVSIEGQVRVRGSVAQAETEETINAELSDIPAGHYHVMGFGKNGGQAGQTVDLADGGTLSLDTPSAAASVNGRIIFDTPRPPGELHLFLSGSHRRAMADVASDGSFKFEKSQAGTFDLDLPPMVVSSFQAKGARVEHERLEIAAGASVDLTVHVQGTETLAEVEGLAFNGDLGMAGAMVLLLPQDLARIRLIRRDQSDADGSFSLKGVQAGRYTLVAIDDGRELPYKDGQAIKPYLAGGLSITVPLKSNEQLKVPVQTRKP